MKKKCIKMILVFMITFCNYSFSMSGSEEYRKTQLKDLNCMQIKRHKFEEDISFSSDLSKKDNSINEGVRNLNLRDDNDGEKDPTLRDYHPLSFMPLPASNSREVRNIKCTGERRCRLNSLKYKGYSSEVDSYDKKSLQALKTLHELENKEEDLISVALFNTDDKSEQILELTFSTSDKPLIINVPVRTSVLDQEPVENYSKQKPPLYKYLSKEKRSRTRFGSTLSAIRKSDKADDFDIVSLNKYSYKRPQSLIEAIYKEDLFMIADIVMKGEDINKKCKNGEFPLYIATKLGQHDVVTWLLSNGAIANLRTNKGFTALHIASLNGDLDLVKSLSVFCDDFNIKTKMGMTPLWLASCNGHEHVVNWLLSKGASVNCFAQNCFTPLHIASQNGYLEVVKILDQFGANVFLRTVYGDTCLHIAAYHRHLDIIKYLIKYQALMNSINNECQTMLDIATEVNCSEIIDFVKTINTEDSL